MSTDRAALQVLAARLREEETPISDHVVEPGPASDEGLDRERALVVESVREGYLLHYGESRLLGDPDPDLALLAGDYLYALGIERLAALGDTASVKVLADLISRCAQLHTEDREDEVVSLWKRSIEEIERTPLNAPGRSGSVHWSPPAPRRN
jgi:hypothetical protein